MLIPGEALVNVQGVRTTPGRCEGTAGSFILKLGLSGNFLGLGLMGLLLAAGWALAPPARAQDYALLGAIDKITGRLSRLTAAIDRPLSFGTLEIVARACHTADPAEPLDYAAFMEITEAKKQRLLFSGWFLASSPALSALDHPIYDVWLLRCVPPPQPRLLAPLPQPSG